ncbi:unnamed protein product [Caenorhabditis auriculariae]|uniref:Uncharacterized protein n=1 Tax=Caenorhabditis auriculariae TaxID=2777116 RepID=A0A8S1GVB1_9PELO|nr:unnamed protein product [Caenorhabditis auriculariae]
MDGTFDVSKSLDPSYMFYLSSSFPISSPPNLANMFVLHSKPVTFSCGGPFASSSCQSEYDGKMEAALESKVAVGGLRRSLRRTSSTLSQQLSSLEICQADATQIEIDVTSGTSSHFYVKIFVPTGEVGLLEFPTYGETLSFTASQPGCGHGVWKFVVCTAVDGKEETLVEKTMNLDGVGTLFFAIDEDLRLRLADQEFLHMGHCHKRRH